MISGLRVNEEKAPSRSFLPLGDGRDGKKEEGELMQNWINRLENGCLRSKQFP